ncbi:hypothetical protein CU280_08750 [Yersinia mollaretii]|nr:hypothetical protein CU280_08750 [Yersinia mollaretii]
MRLLPLAEKWHASIIRHNLPGDMMKSCLDFALHRHFVENDQPAGSQLPWSLPLLNRSCQAPR